MGKNVNEKPPLGSKHQYLLCKASGKNMVKQKRRRMLNQIQPNTIALQLNKNRGK